MALTDVRPRIREVFIVGFAVLLIVLVGATLHQYAATAGSLLVLSGLLLALGYFLYAWAL
jgi:predicted membrane channel-forming protein YqfA (hemolysin III family)